jgi:hypothetical protein
VLVKGKADPITVYEYPAQSIEITVGTVSKEELDPTG